MSFGTIILKRNMKKAKLCNYVIWIETVLLSTCYLLKQYKWKGNSFNGRWIRGGNYGRICWIKSKTYGYLIDMVVIIKKQKAKKLCHKKKT